MMSSVPERPWIFRFHVNHAFVIQRQKSEITETRGSDEKILDNNQLKKMEEQVEEYRQKR